jgi:hypothetical protein
MTLSSNAFAARVYDCSGEKEITIIGLYSNAFVVVTAIATSPYTNFSALMLTCFRDDHIPLESMMQGGCGLQALPL